MGSGNGAFPGDDHEIGVKVPSMTWSQKKQHIYLTIKLPDCYNHSLEIKPDRIHFKGTCGGENYEFMADLFGTIDADKSLSIVTGLCIKVDLAISGEEDKPTCNWPRFTKQEVKIPSLKIDLTDFSDESGSDSEDDDPDPRRNFVGTMMKGIGTTALPAAEPLLSSESDESDDESQDKKNNDPPKQRHGGGNGGRGGNTNDGWGRGYRLGS